MKKAHQSCLSAPAPEPESIHNFVMPEPYVPEKYPDGLHNFEGESKKMIQALNEKVC